VCSHLVLLAEMPRHTLGTCQSTCRNLRPSCLHSRGPHSQVAILHKPDGHRIESARVL
jgi:hypothetical protein